MRHTCATSQPRLARAVARRAVPSVLAGMLLIASGIGAPATLDAQARSLTHAGERRRFIVYTPAGYGADTARRYPVVLNFHGGGMTMAEQMLYTRMNRTADSAGFIVVYPQGIDQDWNVGFGMAYDAGTDDVGFVDALLDGLARDFRVDATRVYATGLSRGGFFCHRLAVELSHRIAAVATVGAPMPHPVRDAGKPRGAQHPVGVLLVHGTDDRIVAYQGKTGGYLSAEDTYAYWSARNGVSQAPERVVARDADPRDSTALSHRERGVSGFAVALITVRQGGHTWPGSDPFNVGLPIGVTSRELDASSVVWAFLSRHRR